MFQYAWILSILLLTACAPVVLGSVVINEIMYYSCDTNGIEEAYEYIELYNAGTGTVDLTGWVLDGVEYTLPTGTTVSAGGYLVCCASQEWVQVAYGITNTVGNWDGRLQNDGETLRLINTFGRIVDEVEYSDEVPWPVAADGYGPSLERINTNAESDSSVNWAPSGQTTNWMQVSWTGQISSANNGFAFYLDYDGKCWLDDVSVARLGGGPNLVTNGDFESGTTGWSFENNHDRSRVVDGAGRSGGKGLAVVCNQTRWILIGTEPPKQIRYGDALSNRVSSLSMATSDAEQYVASYWIRRDGVSDGLYEVIDGHTNGWFLGSLGTPGNLNSADSNLSPVGAIEVDHDFDVVSTATGNVIRAVVSDAEAVDQVEVAYRVIGTNDYRFTDIHYAYLAMRDDGADPDTTPGDGEYAVRLPAIGTNGSLVRYHLRIIGTNGFVSTQPRRDDPGTDFGFWVENEEVQTHVPNWHVLVDGTDLYPVRRRGCAVTPQGQVLTDLYVRHRGSPGYDTTRTGIALRSHRGHEMNTWFAPGEDGINFRFRGNGPPLDPWYQRLVSESIAYDLQRTIGLPTPRTQHACLWIDGQPTITLALEHPGRDFVSEYDIGDDDYLGRWGNTGFNVMQGDESFNNRYAVYIQLQALTGPREDLIRTNFVYETCRYAHALPSLVGNADIQFLWNMFNQRSQDDGRWSYYPWDVDYSFKLVYTNLHPYYATSEHPDIDSGVGEHLAESLFWPESGVNAAFTLPYRYRQQRSLWRYCETLLTTNHLFPKLDQIEQDLLPAYAQIGVSGASLTSQVASVKEFIPARRDFLKNQDWQDKDEDIWSEPYDPTTVVINEIMYDPDAGGEYLELYNRGSQTIDLSWWPLTSGSEDYRLPHGTMLGPYGYLVIADNQEALVQTYPELAHDLAQRYPGVPIWDQPLNWNSAREYQTRIVEIPNITLPNLGTAVSLYDLTSNLVDTVTYAASPPWPDGAGASLELIDPFLDNATNTSWLGSNRTGTPGFYNSVSTNTYAGDLDIPYRDVVVYFDPANHASYSTIYVNKLRNLLGHFRTDVDLKDVSLYSSGDLDSYDAALYLGTSFDEPLPEAFLGDIATATNSVVWLNYNIWRLLWSTNDVSHLGLTYHYVSNGYDRVSYQSEELFKDPGSQIVVVSANGTTPVVHATAGVSTNGAVPPTPYAVQSDNFWYIAGNPFSWQTECNASLVLADLLHDILGTGVKGTSYRALVRLEDVNAGSYSLTIVEDMAQTLDQLGVPASFGIIPRYLDPTNGVDKPMSGEPVFLDTLRAVKRAGGSLLAHGYTHQRDDQESAMGYEFWNGTLDEPLPGDSWDWASGRVSASAEEFLKSGFPVEIWETPHYAASLLDYHVFGSRYNVVFESISASGHSTESMSIPALEALSASNPPMGGQDIPYVCHQSIYGFKLLPENLGYYSPTEFDSNGLQMTISNKVLYARKHRVVRDAVACFFYHPYLGVEGLTNLVQQIRDLGYTFVAPESLYREEPVPVFSEPVPEDHGLDRTFNGTSTNFPADLVVGGTGSGNSLEILSGSAISNRNVLLGVEVSSYANSALVSGASSRWSADGTVVVGRRGAGNQLVVSNGAGFASIDATIGEFAGSTGNVVGVNGTGTTWSNQFGLVVGRSGKANRLYITGGASLDAMFCTVGDEGSGNNEVRVSGTDSRLNARAYVVLGAESDDNGLTIEDGGCVTADFMLTGLGDTASSNSMIVKGADSCLAVSNRIILGVDGPANALHVHTGGTVSAKDLLVGFTDYSTDNHVQVLGGTLDVSGLFEIRHGQAEFSSGTATVNHLNIYDGALLRIHDGFTLDGGQTITNAGTIMLNGPMTIPSDVTLIENGSLGGTETSWVLDGDLRILSTSGSSLLGKQIDFTPGVSHVLEASGIDQGATLSGFGANRSLGSLTVRGTVDVVNVVYCWSLAGNGTLRLDDGDRFYYVEGGGWSGDAVLSGDAVFQKVPVELTTIYFDAGGDVRLEWPSGAGLVFTVEWCDNMRDTPFQHATQITATGDLTSWLDTGSTNRPEPGPFFRRHYRLKVRPE